MVAIIVKNYAHVNRSFPNWDSPNGRIVKNKDHYDRLMKENNMVSYETMQQQAQAKELKPYTLGEKAKDLIKHAKLTANSKGHVQFGDKGIKALKEIGAISNKIPDYMKLPSSYQSKGGF